MFISKAKWDQLLATLEKVARRIDVVAQAYVESDENGIIGVEYVDQYGQIHHKKNSAKANNRSMVTIRYDSDGSTPSEEVLDLNCIRSYIYLDNGTLKAYTHNGDNINFYGEAAIKLHRLLSDSTHGRIGYEIDLRKDRASGTERTLDSYEPDHDPYN